jgi:GAF domain-containing protein/CHASE1-domain containing sensor protein
VITSPGRVGGAGNPPAATPTRPSTPGLWPRIAAVVAVIAIGAAAAWATAQDARRDAERREALIADRTASVFTASVEQLLAAISGVWGLPDAEGNVDEVVFDAYARAATGRTAIEALAYAPLVTAAERPAFESAIGGPIIDEPGGPRAGERDRYLPVQWVTPDLDETAPLIGFDLATDPVRNAAAEQARDSGSTVITRTIPAQPNDQPAVFLVHPVYGGADAGAPGTPVSERRRAVVGYVATGVLGSELLDAVDTRVDGSLGVRITGAAGDDTVLAETEPGPDGGTTVEREAGGRDWLITVDDRQEATTILAPLGILAATAAAAVAVALLARRSVRHQRDLSRHVALVERIAGLGRSLAATGSVAEVARVVEAEVPAVLGAHRARLGGLAALDRDPPAGPDQPGPDGPAPGSGKDVGLDPAPGAGPVAGRRRGRAAGAPAVHAPVGRRVVAPAGATGAWVEAWWGPGRRLDHLTRAGLSTVGEMCGHTLVRARLADRAQRDAITSRLLAGLAEAAATAATTEQVARTLVERAAEVPGAATTHIGIAADDGEAMIVVHRGLSGSEPDRTDVVTLDHPWPMLEALRTAGPVLLPDLDAVAERYPHVVEGMRAAGVAALACLPLVGDDGRPFGAVSLGWAEPQRFDADLVGMLHTTADVCAASLDRARATDRDQARSTAMATLATHLSASATFDEVAGAILRYATPALDADFALVGVVDDDRFRLLVPPVPSLDVLGSYRETTLDGDLPPLLALRRRELVTFATLAEVHDTDLAIDLGQAGVRAGACAPMFDRDGGAAGVFMALWARPPAFDDDMRSRLSLVADLCAQSIERSRLSDDEHRLRRDLQSQIVPAAPVAKGLDVATRYRPAAPSVGMGGDWFDAISLDDDNLCLVVGDVTGHGVGAVAAMTLVRTVVHTLVAGGMALPDVLVRTSDALRRDGLGYATVVIAVIDARAGTLTYVSAGHPPPLVRRPGGTVDVLTGGRHSVLGIDIEPRPPGNLAMPAGATLVAYTDGLIERRDRTIDTGVALLADVLRTAPDQSSDELADRLLAERPVQYAPLDDVALVVARRVR